ncbi:MAG: thioredoxin family protein [Saprospiraceae bacterium]|nr:thioredoxin family protein [Saprospiraceae bacterium]
MSLFLVGVISGQGIAFYETELSTALQIAQKENKSVFVDTYAKWCIPCKKMDKVFRDKSVGKVFNDNFINVKLDMDLPSSKAVKTDYDIIFLPTFMILDPQGRVRYKVDRVLSKDELLMIANLVADPNAYYASDATQIVSSPVVGVGAKKVKDTKPTIYNNTSMVKVSDVKTDGEEKILYVLDGDNASVPPEVLYKEAYFRMELMDGSHHKAAMIYLDSQDDWTSEKNIRFIYDFLTDVNSPLFEFFIENEIMFLEYYEKLQLKITKAHLINQRLYRGLPRPDYEEAVELFKMLDPQSATKKAKQYINTSRSQQ